MDEQELAMSKYFESEPLPQQTGFNRNSNNSNNCSSAEYKDNGGMMDVDDPDYIPRIPPSALARLDTSNLPKFTITDPPQQMMQNIQENVQNTQQFQQMQNSQQMQQISLSIPQI